MITIKIVDGEFKVSGTFDLGYMGIYRDEQINFYDDLEEIKDWEILNDAITSDEKIAEILTDYYNKFEEKIQKNLKQINDAFLIRIFEDMESCEYEFWYNDQITVKEFMPKDTDDIYSSKCDIMRPIECEYDDKPNDGSISKTDVEQVLKQQFPMINWNVLVKSIVPEYIGLYDGEISFQCSDNLGEEILCGAYSTIDEQLKFDDWHNF